MLQTTYKILVQFIWCCHMLTISYIFGENLSKTYTKPIDFFSHKNIVIKVLFSLHIACATIDPSVKLTVID